MGALLSCMSGQDPVKVDPGYSNDDMSVPDVLKHTYVPALSKVNTANEWLPFLAPSQLVEIHTAFKKFDRDGDGHIEPREIQRVMAGVGVELGDAEVKKLIASVDADKSGTVEFDEFMSIMASNMVRDGGSELEQAFTLFDPQRTGFVDLEVARKLLTSTGQRPLTNAEVDDMIAHMGADSNGRIPMARLEGLSAWQSPLAGADGKVLSSVVSDTGEAAAPAAAANPGRIESPHGG